MNQINSSVKLLCICTVNTWLNANCLKSATEQGWFQTCEKIHMLPISSRTGLQVIFIRSRFSIYTRTMINRSVNQHKLVQYPSPNTLKLQIFVHRKIFCIQSFLQSLVFAHQRKVTILRVLVFALAQTYFQNLFNFAL